MVTIGETDGGAARVDEEVAQGVGAHHRGLADPRARVAPQVRRHRPRHHGNTPHATHTFL